MATYTTDDKVLRHKILRQMQDNILLKQEQKDFEVLIRI
jgi:hypothetical protein